MRTIRPRMNKAEYKAYLEFKKPKNNVLVIGDLHAPFIKEGYLEFCQEMYVKHQCSSVVFTGDILDCHYSSFHESDADGFGAGEELKRAKNVIAQFYEAFPNAKVCIGNHDRIPNRKAFAGGLSMTWVKTISEVLDTPNWAYADQFIIDNVMYCHGDGMDIRRRSNLESISVVSGHFHSKSFYETYVGENILRFVLQIGCGIDRHSYAMAYAKLYPKQQINVGIVKDDGRWGMIEHMVM